MKKSKILLLTSIVVGVACLTGCGPKVTIMPEKANSYSAVVAYYNETDANEAAIKKATETCQQQGKRLQVVKHNSQYQGADKNQKALYGTLSTVASTMSAAFGRHGDHDNNNSFVSSSSDSQDDYKIEIQFECI